MFYGLKNNVIMELDQDMIIDNSNKVFDYLENSSSF